MSDGQCRGMVTRYTDTPCDEGYTDGIQGIQMVYRYTEKTWYTEKTGIQTIMGYRQMHGAG